MVIMYTGAGIYNRYAGILHLIRECKTEYNIQKMVITGIGDNHFCVQRSD